MASRRPPSALNIAMLSFIRFFHSIIIILKCLLPRRTPKPLSAPRRLHPQHVALLVAVDSTAANDLRKLDDMVECVRRSVEYCRDAGIGTLSVYDTAGILKTHTNLLVNSIPNLSPVSSNGRPLSVNSEVSYPMTPPPSDGATSSAASTSSTVSPSPVLSYVSGLSAPASTSTSNSGLRQRNVNQAANSEASRVPDVRLHLVCRDQGKPFIARAAQHFGFQSANNTGDADGLSIESLQEILEAEFGSPDLLIVHPLLWPDSPGSLRPKPMEFYGFPPWQMRLSEIYYDPWTPHRFISLLLSRPTASLITESDFRRALDQFGRTEVKVGK